jgi:AraC-like DNA-binding protein
VRLLSRRGFTITAVTCKDDHKGWSEPEPRTGFGLVLARRGRFRLRTGGGVVDIDRTVGYLSVPGQEEQFSHPAGGDVCTSVSVSGELWRGGQHPAVYVDARMDLAHRRLLTAARGQDVDYAVTEELLGLLSCATTPAVAGPDRALVAAARDAIVTDHPAAQGLLPLAAELGVSPYRLSRAFPRHVGVSLTRYRNRVRVGRALDRLEQGERDLAGLAADLGFADQAHLCRTVREHLGHTPTALRAMLVPWPQESSRPDVR